VPRPQSQISPVGTQVLVKVAEAETKTAGGILLAESSQRKPTSGAYPHNANRVPPP
jgi:chaperonin GroES